VLADWLIESQEIEEAHALAVLAEIINLPLPAFLSSLRDTGLFPEALAIEYDRGQQIVDHGKLLAGIELVEMPGVSELNTAQIEADLRAIKNVGAGGLSLSWDLWLIPLERLEIVNFVWFS